MNHGGEVFDFGDGEDEDFIADFLTLYTPIKELGQGAFSSVYSALDHYGNSVAIKVLDKRVSGKSARREVEILSQLDHCNVVRFFQARESPRKIYLITELVEGQTLESFMKRDLTEFQIITIVRQLLEAITYVHSKEFIHRDVKPENILINPNGLQLKLIDFGLSFISQSFQTTHENCGTFIFMAPEMALKKQYFKSVDVWSAGIITYMLFSQGLHPIWQQGVDTRQSYLEKLQKEQTLWTFPENMSKYQIVPSSVIGLPSTFLQRPQHLILNHACRLPKLSYIHGQLGPGSSRNLSPWLTWSNNFKRCNISLRYFYWVIWEIADQIGDLFARSYQEESSALSLTATSRTSCTTVFLIDP